MTIICNESFAQTNSERKKERKIRKNRSGKNTEIRENTEGLEFCLGVKLFRALTNISTYILDEKL